MKRSSSAAAASKARSLQKDGNGNNGEGVFIDWEVRPGGLLVQKRGVDYGCPAATACPAIKIKVSHNSCHHHITIPSESTFGNLKRVIANKIGIEPRVQRLLFRGKEKDDDECLHIAGVQDMSKVILLEDPASKEKGKNQDTVTNNAYYAVANVRAEVDKLSDRVLDMERAVRNSNKIVDKEILLLTELLMMQLFKLDSIEATGKAREQRRTEVHRVQSLVDKLDHLKATKSNGFGNSDTASFVTPKWETFDSGTGTLAGPTTLDHSTQNFEHGESFY